MLGESSHQSGHFAENGVTLLEPLEEYSEDTLVNEVMVESEAIVTSSVLALSDKSRDDEGRGATFSSSVLIDKLIVKSSSLCRDGFVGGSEGLEHDSVGREGMVAALSGEDEDVVRYVYTTCVYKCVCVYNTATTTSIHALCVRVCVHPL